MFTGIIEGLGTIIALRPSGAGRRLALVSDFPLDQTRIGDSIAVNGACLTAVTVSGRHFEVDLSPESLTTTTFSEARSGERVNLERALRLSDRLDGHLVSGHVDAVGVIRARETRGNAILISIAAPAVIRRYLIHKGSVAVDGVSLTVNACDHQGFQVSIIPHTAKLTTVGFKAVGARVNIETDLIGKYVERFTTPSEDKEDQAAAGGIDMHFLNKTGFL
ncbi:MAG: riboflavin synthase [Desulfosarcina sp.]|nr:riboflavin synthase [Desulfobacterales bacterium]